MQPNFFISMQESKLLQFQLPDAVTGNNIGPASFAEAKALVIVFTCNHCPYAIAYEDRLVKLAQKWENQGVQLIAISANDATQYPQDSFELMRERALQRQFPFPYLYDESQAVANSFQAQRTPEVFLFSLMGDPNVVYRGAIDDNYQQPKAVKEPYLDQAIQHLMEGQPIPVDFAPAVGCSIKWKKA